MSSKKSEIIICRMTRNILQRTLIWPNDEDELHPGKWYYIRIIAFVLLTVLWSGSTLIHCILTIKDPDYDFDVTEEVAILVAIFGIYYITFIYVKNQPKVAQLLKDLSNFDNFGAPPNFKEKMQKLDFWSKFLDYYIRVGITAYICFKYSLKAECEKENESKGLHENCGLLSPTWIPFDINYFPVYQLVFLFIFISSQVIMTPVLMISFNALEVGQHLIMRVDHLNSMILQSFDSDNNVNNRWRMVRCIEYHNQILGFVDRLNDCFSTAMFGHLAITSTICGCIAKQFVVGVNRLCAAIHFSGWIVALFVACLGGQLLLDANYTVSNAIWSSIWYKADVKLRKDLLFMLVRSQREFHLTVGSFGVLSFALFVNVVKMSYSILCLLTS